MFKQNIPPQLLTEALIRESIVKDTLDSLGMHTYNTLTWGAAIGAFIGPARAVLANQSVEITPENYVLLATALAAATFDKMVTRGLSDSEKKQLDDELEERRLLGAFKEAKDEAGAIRKVITWFANAMGKGIDEVLGIASFTAFFTPIVDVIVSTTGVIETPSTAQALALIMTSAGIEAFRSFMKFLKRKDREATQTLKDIEATLTRAEKAREEEEAMDVKSLREMIEEAAGQKSMLLESPSYEEQVEIKDKGPAEGRMAKSQLHNIMGSAQYLHDIISDDSDLPEWVEAKITKASDYLTSAKDHLSYETYGGTRGIDQYQTLSKQQALDIVDGTARRVDCPVTKKALIAAVDKLRNHLGDKIEDEEEIMS